MKFRFTSLSSYDHPHRTRNICLVRSLRPRFRERSFSRSRAEKSDRHQRAIGASAILLHRSRSLDCIRVADLEQDQYQLHDGSRYGRILLVRLDRPDRNLADQPTDVENDVEADSAYLQRG